MKREEANQQFVVEADALDGCGLLHSHPQLGNGPHFDFAVPPQVDAEQRCVFLQRLGKCNNICRRETSKTRKEQNEKGFETKQKKKKPLLLKSQEASPMVVSDLVVRRSLEIKLTWSQRKCKEEENKGAPFKPRGCQLN